MVNVKNVAISFLHFTKNMEIHGFIISQYNKIARRIRRTLQCHVRLHFAIMLLHVAIINERGLYNVRKSKRKE